MALRWFYRMEDTILKVLVAPDKSVLGGKLDKKRLWLAEDSSCYEGENDLSCISRYAGILKWDMENGMNAGAHLGPDNICASYLTNVSDQDGP